MRIWWNPSLEGAVRKFFSRTGQRGPTLRNIQALSGAPANNAVYHALIEPGDTILGMNLLHGGHLTHGSSVNRSGKLYKVAHYNVDPVTELIDYNRIEEIAKETNPKVIICGYSSYPWI